MDVLQAIGLNPRRTVEASENNVPDSESWAEIVAESSDDAPTEFDVTESVGELEVDVEVAAVEEIPDLLDDPEQLLGDPIAEDIVALDAPADALTAVVSIQEHMAVSEWDTAVEAQQEKTTVPQIDVSQTPDKVVVADDGATELATLVRTVIPDGKATAVSFANIIAPEIKSPDSVERSAEGVSKIVTQVDTAISKLARPQSEPSGATDQITKAPMPVLTAEETKLSTIVETQGKVPEPEAAERQIANLEKPVSYFVRAAMDGQSYSLADTREIGLKEFQLSTPTTADPRGLMQEFAQKPTEQVIPVSGVTFGSTNQLNAITPNMAALAKDQPVLLQVSRAIETAKSGEIELRLDPAELGKVRITMAARDGVMFVTITAERAETLEMMRRNSESLDATFSEQGFGETQLDFESFGDGEQSQPHEELVFSSEGRGNLDETAKRVVLQHTTDGLDIRL
jgi:flagellar hook-length control protein FliK